MRRLNQVLLVGAGGAVGALIRWGLIELVELDGSFPWATFIANIVGCGALGALSDRGRDEGERSRWFLGAGFCGGLTTMSTLSVEVVELFDHEPVMAVLYLASSVLCGLGAFIISRRAMERSP